MIHNKEKSQIPVVILGGGPVGLAAAAHLALKNQSFVLLEAGETVGSSIRDWGHVQLFSPWKYNTDQAAESLLSRHDWKKPDEEKYHTGNELVDEYLLPLANLPEIKPHIRLNSKVISIGRRGIDKVRTANRHQLPFVIHYQQYGARKKIEAKAVIDATGTWKTPNPIGSGGVYAEGELEASKHIFYGIPDITGVHKSRYEGKTVLVVGSGHSAINTLLDLAKLKEQEPTTKIIWVLRKKSVSETYGGGEDDALPVRGQLGLCIKKLVESDGIIVHTPFYIEQIYQENSQLTVKGLHNDQSAYIRGVNEIIANTGARPDVSFLREVRVDVDAALESVPALAALIDPNIHSCGTVRPHGEAELRQKEQDFYIVGSKSYGRAPTFLLATGYEQVRSVVAYLTGDFETAKRVELNLPETGVCSVNMNTTTDTHCCATGERASSGSSNQPPCCSKA